jgi:colicin import membrane protein
MQRINLKAPTAPFSRSLALHVFLLFLLLVSVKLPQGDRGTPAVEIVQATMIDATALKQSFQITPKTVVKKSAPPQKILEKTPDIEKSEPLAELETQQFADEKKVAQVQQPVDLQKQITDKKKLVIKKIANDKKKTVDKKKAVTKKTVDEKKKVVAKKMVDEKKVAPVKSVAVAGQDDAAKVAQAAQEAQAKKIAAAEKAQAGKLAAAQAAQLNSALEKYKQLIVQAISVKWLVPSTASANMTTKLLIELGAGGVVKNVQLLESSQNAALDRSAIAAVYKASPLPVPDDPMIASLFKSFSLTVSPRDVT